jgi:hypothetical protein
MNNQLEYLNEHGSSSSKIVEGDEKSPELMIAGAFTGLVTVATAISMASNMDVRYCILKFC